MTQSLRVEVRCIACKALEAVYVEPKDYLDWSLKGVHAQDAFPYLTDDEREVLITSMCLDCIEEMYRDLREEEEEDDDYWPWGPDPLEESDNAEYQSDYYVDKDCD